MKFINWTFGSFFRTLGRIFAYIAIGVAIAYFSGFLNIANVNAEVVAMTSGDGFFGISVGGDSNFPKTVNVSSNGENSLLLQIFNYEGISRPYTYLIGSVCTTAILADSYIYNPAYNFYFDEGSFTAYNTNKSCTVGGYGGTIHYFQVQVGKYQDIDMTGEELTASSYLRLVNRYDWSTLWEFRNFYLSSDDFISEMRSNAKIEYQMTLMDEGLADVDNTLNTINGTLNSTNDKLDNLGDKQDETNEKLDQTNDTLTSDDSDVTSKKCGVVCKLKGIFTGITNLPSNIWNSLKGGFEAITSGITNLISNITSEDGPELEGLNSSAGWLPAGPIDSILNLPLSLLNNVSTNLSKTCQPVNLVLPFINVNFQLPCINTIYSKIEGLSALLTTIGVITSGFILFYYLMNLYKWVDDTLTFRENNYLDNWGGV